MGHRLPVMELTSESRNELMHFPECDLFEITKCDLIRHFSMRSRTLGSGTTLSPVHF